MAPELVGVHLPVPAHAPDARARGVAAVPLEQLQHLFGACRVLAQKLQVDEGPVGVVVHREDLGRPAPVEPVARPVHDEAHSRTRLGMVEVLIHERAPPPRVHEVVEAGALHAFRLHDVEHVAYLAPVALVDGHAQAHLDARRLRVAHALDGAVEAAGQAAELVVRLARAIERHAHVRKPHVGEARRQLRRDERAVRRQDHAHAAIFRVLHELDHVLAHARLPSREQQHGRAERGQVVDHGLRLAGRHLALVALALGSRVAVHAAQVARLRAVPHHDGFLVARELQQLAGELARLAVVAQHVGRLDRPAVQLGYSDHIRSFTFR